MHLDITKNIPPSATTTHPTVEIRVSLAKGGPSLDSLDEQLRVTDEFLTYLADRRDEVERVTFRFVSAADGYEPSLAYASPHDADVPLTDSLTLPMPAQRRLLIGLEPTGGAAKPKVPLDITIKTRKRGGGNL